MTTVKKDKWVELTKKMLFLGIQEKDIEEKFIRSSGPGGQKTNKTSTCVMLKHLPTGVIVKCQEARTQNQNRFFARRRLVLKIDSLKHGRESEEAKKRYKIRKQKQKRSKRAKEKILQDKRLQSEKKEMRKNVDPTIWAMLFLFLLVGNASADLAPSEVILVYNSNYPGSKKVAEYYQKKRMISDENVFFIFSSNKESISRKIFNETIKIPIQKMLQEHKNSEGIRSLVLFYGIPLKIQGSKGGKGNESASVDSELMLARFDDYALEGWLVNPLYWQALAQPGSKPKSALIVARIDGPNRRVCERMIDDALVAEKNGLIGISYIDARGRAQNSTDVRKGQEYASYDQSLRALSRLTEKLSLLTVLNDKEALFQAGKCPDAALYCGWYRYGNYLDAFDFVPGAIGYHLASGEASSLRKGNAWCKGLIEDGITVTLGPVSEPYLGAFPPPELFFALVFSGRFSIGEVFAMTTRSSSWKMVLIGDPMYNPYRNNPLLHSDDLDSIFDVYRKDEPPESLFLDTDES